ncbi:glycosyl transferase group 1 (plasmid) [Gloeothece citriformis PCC 7424]|uniref:Glycosyl transferase group 1 n=1 Tax=Gloeothece citriformis (strain PCC 7424) TaxID=65393 RepID=B7KM09_GLOC7|nr:glycosyltransferase family 4 protein [Gloeothece citriformis]ACK73831.1 glycosyl transferase group 1 [Gloeothece citriformis PCC 7424]
MYTKENSAFLSKAQPIKKQVLYIVTQFYPPDYAPTGQLIQELVTHLASQDYLIKIFTGQPGYAYQQTVAPAIETFLGGMVKRTRATQFWNGRIRGKLINGILFFLRAGIHLLKNVQKENKLLLTTAPAFLIFLGYFLKVFRKISYVCLIYDLYPDVAVQLKVVSPKNLIVKLWEFLNVKTWEKAEKIIVLNSSMKNRILAKHPQFYDKISVIHNWADPKWIVPLDKSDNWFAQNHNLVDKFTVLYSGNMGRCHDVTTILDAVLQLQNAPIQFVFIGGGAEYEKLLKQVKSWGLKNCLFLPYQDKQILPYSLTACDLSIVSIKPGMEGIVAPSKFYSMLAAGRPIVAICEKHSYLRQIINDAKCGIAIENGDGSSLSQFIKQMASQPELAQKIGKAGQLYLTLNFTPEIIAKQYSEVLGIQPSISNNIMKEQSLKLNYYHSFLPINYLTKPIGEILQEMQLLSKEQVEEILDCQSNQYKNLRFGEIAVLKGWLKPETINFVLYYEQSIKKILLETHSFLTVPVNDILENQTIEDSQLQFWELAVQKGWMKEKTINLLMETVGASSNH